MWVSHTCIVTRPDLSAVTRIYQQWPRNLKFSCRCVASSRSGTSRQSGKLLVENMIGYRHFWLNSKMYYDWPCDHPVKKYFDEIPCQPEKNLYENTIIITYLATSLILKSYLATSLRKYFTKWADNILTIADQSGKLSKCSNVEDFTFKLWIALRWFPRKALSWHRIYLFIHMFWAREEKF